MWAECLRMLSVYLWDIFVIRIEAEELQIRTSLVVNLASAINLLGGL